MTLSHRAAPRRKISGKLLAGTLFLLCMSLLFLPIPRGRAADGRDYVGFYEVVNPTSLANGQIQVTLLVRVFNFSGADISNATITLQDSLDLGTDYGSYPGTVSVADADNVRLSADFVISPDEFTRWQNQGPPSLRIDYQDSSGNAVRQFIELNSTPVGD